MTENCPDSCRCYCWTCEEGGGEDQGSSAICRGAAAMQTISSNKTLPTGFAPSEHFHEVRGAREAHLPEATDDSSTDSIL